MAAWTSDILDYTEGPRQGVYWKLGIVHAVCGSGEGSVFGGFDCIYFCKLDCIVDWRNVEVVVEADGAPSFVAFNMLNEAGPGVEL